MFYLVVFRKFLIPFSAGSMPQAVQWCSWFPAQACTTHHILFVWWTTEQRVLEQEYLCLSTSDQVERAFKNTQYIHRMCVMPMKGHVPKNVAESLQKFTEYVSLSVSTVAFGWDFQQPVITLCVLWSRFSAHNHTPTFRQAIILKTWTLAA